MDGGAWWAAAHGVEKSRTRLSDFTFSLLSCIGEGNGNPLQCSCLKHPFIISKFYGSDILAHHSSAGSLLRVSQE